MIIQISDCLNHLLLALISEEVLPTNQMATWTLSLVIQHKHRIALTDFLVKMLPTLCLATNALVCTFLKPEFVVLINLKTASPTKLTPTTAVLPTCCHNTPTMWSTKTRRPQPAVRIWSGPSTTSTTCARLLASTQLISTPLCRGQ